MLPKFKISTILTIIAAMASVFVMYLQYRDGHYFYSKDIENTPTYTFNIKTFDKDKIPEDIYDILSKDLINKKQDINNEFDVKHVSGKSLKDIKIDIKSETEIKDVVIKNGDIKTKVDISKDKKSARIAKDELIPGSAMSGVVITTNLSKVEMLVYSDNAKYVKIEEKSEQPKKIKEESLISSVMKLVQSMFSIIFLLAIPYLIYKSIDHEKYKYTYDNVYTYYLYLGLAISANWGSILANMFFAHALYFLGTREALITAALEKITNPEVKKL